MKAVLCLLVLVSVAFATRVNYNVKVHQNSLPAITQELVDSINAQGKWKAGLNKGTVVDGITFEQAKRLMGARTDGLKLPQQVHPSNIIASLPTSFSAIDNWPQCPSIGHIRDQSACGSCYAFGGVEAMSDRICIHLDKNVSLSAADAAFCCSSCGYGCGGGQPAIVWSHWVSTGIVEEACYPYPLPGCNHHIPGSNGTKECNPNKEYPTPKCAAKCTNTTWDGPGYQSDRHKGKSANSFRGANQIMAEIMTNGPVEAVFEVYQDFLTYKSGVYQHSKDSHYLSNHAIKILGWGVDSGTPYWIIANSWNPNWGNDGFFWMLRGSNECGIEDSANGGLPLN
jgi:cathepsin B